MKNTLRYTNTRCSVCNKVSAEEIQTELGDFTKQAFVPDPINSLFFVCESCKEIHEELMREYEIEDYFKELEKTNG